MKKKKLLLLTEVFYPENFLINDWVAQWERNGGEIEVLTRTPSYPYGRVYAGYKNKLYQTTYFNTVKVHRIPVCQGYSKSVFIKVLNYFTFVFWSCWVVLLIGRHFDRVFIYQTGPLTLATAGIFLKKWYKAKVIIWTQDLWPETVYAYGFKKTKLLHACLNRFVRWIYKNSDEILVSCEGFGKRLLRYVPEKEIRFVPNWSLVEYNPQAAVASLPGKFNFTFAGNIGKVQNLENVLQGFSLFATHHPEVWFNLIGDGSHLEYLKYWVLRHHIPRVNFIGRIPLEQMSGYYSASDVLVVSLKDVPVYELTVPSKVQAYLVTGKPVYAVLKGETKALVERYGVGYTADPGDIQTIADGFEYFFNASSEKLREMSCRAHYVADTIYNKENIIEKINSIIK